VFKRNCAVCGSQFETINFNKKTCSKLCQKKYRRAYLYEWERNKRLTDKTYREKIQKWHRETYRKYKKKYNKRNKRNREILKEKALKFIGSICIICGSTERRLIFHEIHGKKHILSMKYYSEHAKDFVPICQRHHQFVHDLASLPKEKIEKIMELIEVLR